MLSLGYQAVRQNAEGDRDGMKHTRPITRKPTVAQVSNLAIIKEFLINLTDQIIEFFFILTD